MYTLKGVSVKNIKALKSINDRCRSSSTRVDNFFKKQKYKKVCNNEYLSMSCRKNNNLLNRINKETMLLKEKIFNEESKALSLYKYNTEKDKFKNKINVLTQSLNNFFEGKDNKKYYNYNEEIYPFQKHDMNVRIYKINKKFDEFISSSVRMKKTYGRYYNNIN